MNITTNSTESLNKFTCLNGLHEIEISWSIASLLFCNQYEIEVHYNQKSSICMSNNSDKVNNDW